MVEAAPVFETEPVATLTVPAIPEYPANVNELPPTAMVPSFETVPATVRSPPRASVPVVTARAPPTPAPESRFTVSVPSVLAISRSLYAKAPALTGAADPSRRTSDVPAPNAPGAKFPPTVMVCEPDAESAPAPSRVPLTVTSFAAASSVTSAPMEMLAAKTGVPSVLTVAAPPEASATAPRSWSVTAFSSRMSPTAMLDPPSVSACPLWTYEPPSSIVKFLRTVSDEPIALESVFPVGMTRSRNTRLPESPPPIETFLSLKSSVPAFARSPAMMRSPPFEPESQTTLPAAPTSSDASVWLPSGLFSPVCVKEPEETLMSPAAKARVPTVTDAPFTSKVAVPPS